MRKRLIVLFSVIILSIGFIGMGIQYYRFVSQMIYTESAAHLTEIYHQANQSLHNLVSRNWDNMHMWRDYLQDVIVNSVVPGQLQIMVFAVAVEPGIYQGFDYEAIAIGFNNSDLVETLEISAFAGKSNSYVVHSDGRVIVDDVSAEGISTYNYLAMLKKKSTMSSTEMDSLKEDVLRGQSGAITFRIEKTGYYLIYESAGFDDWMVLGVVPTKVVNASMNNLQSSTMLLVGGILLSLGISEEEAREDIRKIDLPARDRDTIRVLDQRAHILPGQQGEWDREFLQQKTGEIRWFHVIALCRDIQNEKKYILVMSDRTKDKKINQALEEAVSAAESANRAKSTFLSNMSHDIRTPMNAIIGFATLATANIDKKDKVKDYLAKILASGNHLLSLINDVLDMSRIESGKIHLEETEVNLSDVLHDLKTIISGQIHAKQLELYMDTLDVVDEDVLCDKIRLNQVLLNLLSNAIKFTHPGGTVSVRVTQIHNAPEGKGLYEFRVKDNGIGMSPEFARRIFEPFERERSSTVSNIQGTGLGMAISRNIIDMMGGTIEVQTEQGKGTEFIIHLEMQLQSEHRSVEKLKELEGLKALVVDDDFNTCDSVTKMLVQVGMRSEWTLSGKEAVLRAKQSIEMNDAFSAYIIDWRLPDMNGIEVTRRIRALGDDTPIIILTAYDWTDIETEAKEAGVTAFCSKPMFMSDLRESLLTALGQQKAKAESILPDPYLHNGFKGKRLLLAEDNDLNREIALEILGEYGFYTDTAENGETLTYIPAALYMMAKIPRSSIMTM